MLRKLPSQLICAATLAVLALASAGCEETPPPKDPSAKLDAAEIAKIKKSRARIDGAKDALDTKNFDQARKLLREAAELGVESHKFEIEETADRIDKRQAKAWANEAHDLFEQKKCRDAFSQLSEQINGLESEAFTRELRRLTGAEAEQCANRVVDELSTAGKFAEARTFINSGPTKDVLGPTDQKKMARSVDLVIAEALKGQVAGEIKEKKWGEALAKIDAAVKGGSATDEIAAQVLATIRKAAAPDLASQAQGAIGVGSAPKQLAAIDETIKLLRWEPNAPDGTPAPKEKAMPDDLAGKRDALATWVEAQRLRIKMGKKPEKRWLHGKFGLIPAMKTDAASRRDLAPGMELWVLGTAKDKALVAEVDPDAFALPALFEKAVGWVKLDRLKGEPTADWLLPDDQLKGEQVWGPLRAGDALLELGTVVDVKGKDISVKRLSDGQVAKFQRAKLRPAKIAVGVQLTGVCVKDKAKVVKIDEIVPPGRSVKFNCEGTEGIKEEVLESLHTKVELLPASK